MARPRKSTLDYYPKDTDQNTDPKIQYLMAVHGALGKHVYNVLLDHIYGRDAGYYMVFDDRRKLLFCDEEKLEGELVSDVIETCLEEELFDRQLYQEADILTSEAIQRRYLKAGYNRGVIELDPEILFLTKNEAEELVSKQTTVVFLQTTHKARAKSKVNKNKEKEIKEEGESESSGRTSAGPGSRQNTPGKRSLEGWEKYNDGIPLCREDVDEWMTRKEIDLSEDEFASELERFRNNLAEYRYQNWVATFKKYLRRRYLEPEHWDYKENHKSKETEYSDDIL